MTSQPAVTPVTVRRLNADDRLMWEPLWRGYLKFYGKEQNDEMIDLTWSRIIQSEDVEGAIVVDGDGTATGLIHYFFHPSTSRHGDNCYIPDLFVLPSNRGHGVGRILIDAVVAEAKQKQAAVVYWQTEEFNGPARRLYEKVAKRSPFIRYEIIL